MPRTQQFRESQSALLGAGNATPSHSDADRKQYATAPGDERQHARISKTTTEERGLATVAAIAPGSRRAPSPSGAACGPSRSASAPPRPSGYGPVLAPPPRAKEGFPGEIGSETGGGSPPFLFRLPSDNVQNLNPKTPGVFSASHDKRKNLRYVVSS